MKKAIPFLLLIILFAVAAWYSFIKQPDPVHEIPPPYLPPAPITQAPQVEPGIEEDTTEFEHEPVVIAPPLPSVIESDATIKLALAEVPDK